MSTLLRHRRALLVIGWLMVAGAVLTSLLPSHSLPVTRVSDKVEHGAVYMVLALWFAGVYPRSRYLFIALGLFTMGIAIEWAQGAMNLGRHSDLRDVVANFTGIALGLTLALAGLGGWAQRLEALVRKS
jgi:VanZ family protein